MRIRWRGLELPSRVIRDEEVSRPTYGRFIVEPFERGFGTTIGNSLRRILLSSLEGAAVTHVRIKGVDHEFTTIRGVLEDVTVIILNVKSLIVQSTSDSPKTMRVAVTGKSGQMVEVKAGRIVCDPAIEIVNADQLLATLTDEVEFEMEMTVARGRGYATAEENKPEGDQIMGLIPVDSVFSPVTRVRYRVEDTRVGQRTNYDRLIMEVWTNGTISPEMALVEAAKILRKHVNSFVQHFDLGSGLATNGSEGEFSQGNTRLAVPDANVLSTPISSLDLSVRASNCLASAGVNTVGELIQWDESGLLKLRSFGKTSLREVKRKLADMGLSLRSDGKESSLDDADSESDELSEANAEDPEDARDTEDAQDGFGSAMREFGVPPPSAGAYPGAVSAEPPAAPAEKRANNEVGVNSDAG